MNKDLANMQQALAKTMEAEDLLNEAETRLEDIPAGVDAHQGGNASHLIELAQTNASNAIFTLKTAIQKYQLRHFKPLEGAPILALLPNDDPTIELRIGDRVKLIQELPNHFFEGWTFVHVGEYGTVQAHAIDPAGSPLYAIAWDNNAHVWAGDAQLCWVI